MPTITGDHERRRAKQLRYAIGNRLGRGERRLEAADLAAELGAEERTVKYLLRRACRVRGLDVVEKVEANRNMWVVV
jgi:hypothetical protein